MPLQSSNPGHTALHGHSCIKLTNPCSSSAFISGWRSPTQPRGTVTEPSTSTQTLHSPSSGGARLTSTLLDMAYQLTIAISMPYCLNVQMLVQFVPKHEWGYGNSRSILPHNWLHLFCVSGCLGTGRKPLRTWPLPVSWTMMTMLVPCWKRSSPRYLECCYSYFS